MTSREMKFHFFRWAMQGARAANEYKWLLVFMMAILSMGTKVGTSYIMFEMRREIFYPLSSMIRWDFERRGIWNEYLKHVEEEERANKAFHSKETASSGYPIFRKP